MSFVQRNTIKVRDERYFQLAQTVDRLEKQLQQLRTGFTELHQESIDDAERADVTALRSAAHQRFALALGVTIS